MLLLIFSHLGSYGLGIARKHCCKSNLHNIYMVIIYQLSKTLFWFHISNILLLIILKITCFRVKLKWYATFTIKISKIKIRNSHHTHLQNSHRLVVLVCAWNCCGRCRWVVLSKRQNSYLPICEDQRQSHWKVCVKMKLSSLNRWAASTYRGEQSEGLCYSRR